MRIVVVGASLGGLRAVEALRRRGWTGQVTVVGAEPYMPYSRPPLTKGTLPADADITHVHLKLRELAADIDWRLSSLAEHCDTGAQRIELADGETIDYDGLVIATGVRPRRLTFDGPAPRRMAFRTYDDFVEFRSHLVPARRMVCAGAGFIGCEIAGTAAARGVQVSVVDVAPTPMLRPLGPEVGSAIGKRHAERGVAFHLSRAITDASDSSVHLSDGAGLDCDVLVEALGTVPNVEWLAGSGLDLSDGVLCDGHLRAAGADNVVVVGDVARFPNPLFDDVPRRVEHWNMAGETARRAAATLLDMLAGAEPDERIFAPMPSFWSDQQVVRIQSFGAPALADRAKVLEGDLAASAAVGYFRGGERIGVVLLDLARRAPHYRAWLAESIGSVAAAG